MRLVYAWIDEYLNIKNQGINFGSQWIYSHRFDHISNSLRFDRLYNTNFLPNFFSLDESKFDNVTAIVGQNGAGKTNILEFLGSAIKEDFGFSGRLIFEDEEGKILIKPGNATEATNRILLQRGIELDSFLITATFDFDELLSERKPEVIYYSPTYDFRPGTTDKQKWINVSSNYLIYNDGIDRRAKEERNFNGVVFHRLSEIQRQLNFLSNLSKLGFKDRLKAIFLPDQITVTFVQFEIPNDGGLSEPRNFSIAFRSFLKNTFIQDGSIWENEVDNINAQQNQEIQKFEKLDDSLHSEQRLKNIIRWKTLIFALKNVFAAIVKNSNVEPGNALYHQEFRESLKEISYSVDPTLNYASMSYKDQSAFERHLVTFVSNQDTFNTEAILQLFEEIKIAIFSNDIADWDTSYDKCQIKMSRDSVYPLLRAYRDVLSRHTFIINVPMIWGFIDFEWNGMSSGEIAFLSLLSRMYLAEDLLLARTENTQYENDQKPYPASIIIFIDEGELGFHLQWQKQYLSLLVESLPRIFRGGTTIQLVFASHSPITLSDIPKSHIVLLKKLPNNSEMEVLDASELSVNTFAGNIYDLLKDSFFLTGGFIGDFAEKKINRLIHYLRQNLDPEVLDIKSHRVLESAAILNSEEFNMQSAKALIQIVDEPILRRKLSELYIQKFSDASEEDKIREEIERLQARLQSIKTRK